MLRRALEVALATSAVAIIVVLVVILPGVTRG